MKILYIILLIFFINIDTYSQNIEFEDFGYVEEPENELNTPNSMAEYSYSTPQLIPLKNKQNWPPIIIHTDKIDKEMRLAVDVRVRFSNNLKKAKNVKLKYVYLASIKIIDKNHLIDPYSIKNEEDFILWSIVSEKFINWMYNQPFSDYYNRANIYPQYKELLALAFVYPIKILPLLQGEY